MPDISAKIAGLELENPLILASGILDENGYTMRRIMEEGAAAVVTKSIGIDERAGYRPPVIAEVDSGLLNAVGLANPGIESFGEEIEIALTAGKPVIGSIFASTVEDFVNLAEKMEKFSVSGVELNLSCPHVEGFGTEVGSDASLVEEIVTEIKKKISVPLFAKLSPNVSNMLEIAKAAERADAYVLINTVRGMSIDINARKPVLSNRYGGLSGSAIKPVGIRYVYEVKKETGKEIVGVGGIETGYDAIEYIMAGASALQIGTALFRHGRRVFDLVNGQINDFMAREKVDRIDELIGVAISG
ncbi:dihydroorotate dehydrogenase [uncultured archaeon]|nr:dihydroorotate dehydrogenase [uncultured archaeon]HKJ96786.1 dihydroorotate dehydrogenase [Thermoplasmataceae archaeon]